MKQFSMVIGILLLASSLSLGDELLKKEDEHSFQATTLIQHRVESDTTTPKIAMKSTQAKRNDSSNFNEQNNIQNSQNVIQTNTRRSFKQSKIESYRKEKLPTLGLLSESNTLQTTNSQAVNRESTIQVDYNVWDIDEWSDFSDIDITNDFNNLFVMTTSNTASVYTSDIDHPRLFQRNRHIELGVVNLDNRFSQNLITSIMKMPIKVLDLGAMMTEQ